MFDYNLSELLSRFRDHFGSDRLTDVEERLCRELGADQVEFLDAAGRHLHRMIPFREAIESAMAVQVIFPLSRSNAYQEVQEASPGNERVEANPHQSIIRELDRLEQQKDANWAGFIVNTLLPQMGYTIEEARGLLQRLEKAGIIHLFKRPNPRSPERPTTFVQLNRDNPMVRSVLAVLPGHETGHFSPPRPRGNTFPGDIICGRR